MPAAPLVLRLPFMGSCIVQNSPARRVPSHGTDMFAVTYAIDFVEVDGQGRTAPTRSWRTALATEPPELFFAFGSPVVAPVSGVVRSVHDGEEDHEARRSQLSLLGYMLTQPQRVKRGPAGVAGNYIIVEDDRTHLFVAAVHLQRGSMQVREGQHVRVGQSIARCGNSGNSTQPHVHLQVMDNLDLGIAKGVPVAFSDYLETTRGSSGPPRRVANGVPGEGSVVQPAGRAFLT